jgi:hypothetical protein
MNFDPVGTPSKKLAYPSIDKGLEKVQYRQASVSVEGWLLQHCCSAYHFE